MSLVKIENGQPITDSLTVAETFGKQHKDVLRHIRNLECSFEFNQRNFAPIDYVDAGGRKYRKQLITQDGFTFLAMGYTGKEAARFKEMYISEFNRMREELNKPQFHIPQTKVEALEAYLLEMKRSERLESEKLMLEQRVKEYEPKVSYLDTILQSKDSITVTQIAKDYGLTGYELNKLLHEEKIQYKMNKQWLLYRDHQDKGYTKSTTWDVHHTDGTTSVKMNTRWTQKGRLFIHETLGARGIVPYMDREQSKEA